MPWGHADATLRRLPVVKAWAAAAIDRDTGTVLYNRNGTVHLPPASLTKVMTALVVLKHVRKLDSYARVPREAIGKQGQRVGLAAGDRITIRNLLRGSLTKSASDCTITLAHYVAGSEKAFVPMMNAEAKRIGMTNTHFANSVGIIAPSHYSSALDLARLARVAMENARFRPFVAVWQTHVRWPPHNDLVVRTRNWLVRYYSWADGIKTGNTSVAGLCMMASGTFDSRPLIVVTLHEGSVESERADVLKLFRYGSRR
jgi:D-alanyl-D-alanine carboxypeptidase (penicillin-binding protein 5/6)